MLVVISSIEENTMEGGVTGDGGWRSESIVFIIYCCVTNFPKTVSESSNHLSSPVFWVRNPGCLGPLDHMLQSKCPLGLTISSLAWGKILFQAPSHGTWQDWFLWGSWMEGGLSSPLVAGESPSTVPCHVGLSIKYLKTWQLVSIRASSK